MFHCPAQCFVTALDTRGWYDVEFRCALAGMHFLTVMVNNKVVCVQVQAPPLPLPLSLFHPVQGKESGCCHRPEGIVLSALLVFAVLTIRWRYPFPLWWSWCLANRTQTPAPRHFPTR